MIDAAMIPRPSEGPTRCRPGVNVALGRGARISREAIVRAAGLPAGARRVCLCDPLGADVRLPSSRASSAPARSEGGAVGMHGARRAFVLVRAWASGFLIALVRQEQ